MTATNETPTLDDPARTERVGTALAGRLRDKGITAVVCWDDSEDAVVAHVVARELGVGLRLAEEIEGIVTLERPLPENAVVALVAEELTARTAVAGLAGVVRHSGARVAAVATVRTTAVVAETEAADATVLTAEDA
jgi:hypothetical protein